MRETRQLNVMEQLMDACLQQDVGRLGSFLNSGGKLNQVLRPMHPYLTPEALAFLLLFWTDITLPTYLSTSYVQPTIINRNPIILETKDRDLSSRQNISILLKWRREIFQLNLGKALFSIRTLKSNELPIFAAQLTSEGIEKFIPNEALTGVKILEKELICTSAKELGFALPRELAQLILSFPSEADHKSALKKIALTRTMQHLPVTGEQDATPNVTGAEYIAKLNTERAMGKHAELLAEQEQSRSSRCCIM
jgi:hypothetical protein